MAKYDLYPEILEWLKKGSSSAPNALMHVVAAVSELWMGRRLAAAVEKGGAAAHLECFARTVYRRPHAYRLACREVAKLGV